MSLHWEEADGVGIARPAGPELAADSASAFRTEMAGRLTGTNWVVIDLDDVRFMDSSGLGAVVSVLKGLRGRGELRLCGVSPQVEALFRLTKMLNVLPIEATREAAVASLQRSREAAA